MPTTIKIIPAPAPAPAAAIKAFYPILPTTTLP
jgi:hypothetical protein